jgi:hypothetical protein
MKRMERMELRTEAREANEASEWSWWISNRLPDDDEDEYIPNSPTTLYLSAPGTLRTAFPKKEAW